MSDSAEAIESAQFKDRKIGLVVFGILEIMLGSCCALMALFMLVITAMAPTLNVGAQGPPPIDIRSMISSLFIYGLAALWFVCMGIGSILTRRWARALVLVSSWIWLIVGISGLISMLVMMPAMFDQMAANGQIPSGIASVMKVVMLGFMMVIYILIPGSLVLFYRSKHVKATCEFRDAKPRWTDRCPLPVLALSLMCCACVCSMPLMACYNWAMPFFGSILTGPAGAGAALAYALLAAYIAWGTFKLDIKAWWCFILIIIVATTSAVMTFSEHSLMELYEKMNFPEQQMEMMRQLDLPGNAAITAYMSVCAVVMLGYVIYTKRYFEQHAE